MNKNSNNIIYYFLFTLLGLIISLFLGVFLYFEALSNEINYQAKKSQVASAINYTSRKIGGENLVRKPSFYDEFLHSYFVLMNETLLDKMLKNKINKFIK
ncbi:hypothetical protein [Candidatus Phytoplasma pruni]|uniref:Sensor histidine kinase n=1 Tax=Candidatus Phytoplasma pruni TaxID=479893 RepID=A0A851HB56_9MOLU|nr:hypothetical protein [Candidatus Phytoplasma pruni]NWN46137.1 hypothetical protein [Candidatus Phytoplasma pruni]